MTSSLFDTLSHGLTALLTPVSRAVETPGSLNRLLAAIGVVPQPGTGTDALLAALNAVVVAKNRIEALAAQDTPSFASIAATLDASADAFTALQHLEQTGPLSGLEDVGRDLINLLIIAFLESRWPVARHVAALLTLLDPADEQQDRPPVIQNGRLVRDSYRLDRFHLERLPQLLRDPVATLQSQYGNALLTTADAHAMADKLFPRLMRLLRSLGVSCRYGFDPDDAAFLGDAGPLMAHSLIIYVDDPLNGAAAEAGLVLSLSAADQGDLGLVISPFGTTSVQRTVGPWTIGFDLTAGVDVVAWGRNGLTLLASAGTTEVTGHVSASLPSVDDGPAYVFGEPDGTRLELGAPKFSAAVDAAATDIDVTLSAETGKSALVIHPGDGDGFISSILPSDGMRAEFDLGLAWSNKAGLSLHGGAGLEATLPINRSIAGIITLSSAHLSLQAQDGRVTAETSLTGGLSIGPVKAVVDRIGLSTVLTFPPSAGNLGVADLDFDFKPPTGIGLSIDTQGVVSGGGFLFHDPVQSLYAGVMQLSISDAFTVTAFGLIATKMPDGSPGYSLIVFITAEDFQPIPLGMGFTLQGIGGMVAINRTFDQDVLRAGMQNDTLKTLLFPRDPVTNAPTIIRSLASAFPAKRGSYLLGILARIGWFTPTLIQLDLALILEFGARKRLLVLGRISALLPSPDNDLVRINLDAIGVLDFDQDTASIDAMLIDSRLAKKFVLTGAAALRAGWGSGPHQGFVLAVGGFNPHFAPPAGVPPLSRVAIALSSGNNPRLTCEAYFAITANTIQFGARAALYAEAYSFSISGDIGFDVLITRAPLHFIADYHASVQLKYGSHNLFKVSVDGSLEGPRPLRVSGKATFEIFWCDFSVRFDKTLIDGDPPPPPPAVDVLAELNRALATAQSWSTQAPPNATHGVALRKLAAGTALVLDPLGRLAIRQDVVPLNTGRDIDLFGGAPVAGAHRFALAATLNNVDLKDVTTLQAPFAPAQFFAMSDDDKIASPSFAQMDAGFVVGKDDAVTIDANELVPARLDYDSIVIDTLAGDVPPPQPKPYSLPPAQLAVYAATGAAARAPVRSVGRARFRTPGKPAVDLAEPTWAIAPLDAGPPVAVAANVKTWSEYQGALTTLNRAGAQFQLVPAAALAA
ncbi:MAG: DUF6603 domain-containing protein [Reyranella sp.]